MGFAPSGIIYILNALAALALAGLFAKRASIPNQPRHWKIHRIFMVTILLVLSVDNIRVMMGSTDAWRDAFAAGEEPAGAFLIYPLLAVHVIAVPLIMNTVIEYAIGVPTYLAQPTSEVVFHKSHTTLRLVIGFISLFIAAFGVYYLYVELYNVGIAGLEGVDTGENSVKWVAPQEEQIEASNGTLIHPVGTDLMGVLGYSFTTVAVGIYLAVKIKWPTLAITSIITLVGQGLGPLNSTYAFYSANVLEILSFTGVYLADRKVLNLEKGKDDMLDSSA